jgi:hypothetical protein
MNTPPSESPRSFALVVGIGALQGVLLWWLSGASTDETWPATSTVWFTTWLLAAVYLPPIIYGLSAWAGRLSTWIFVGAAGLLLVGAGVHFGRDIVLTPVTESYGGSTSLPLFLLAFVFLFHAIPFAQVYLDTGRWRPDYSLLFSHTWRNALQLALAGLFTGVFWILLHLGLELFDMIGIHTPKALFTVDMRLSLLVAAIVYGIGFHMAGSADRLLLALRQQVLTLLKWLALVATLILVLFTVALLMRAPALIAEHKHVVRASWLLWLTLITVYLYNAAYQDGRNPEPYPAVAGRVLRYAAPLLTLISGMALYALMVRVDAYGFTVARIWALVVALIALGYALTYAWASLRPGPWMGGMGRANVGVAIAVLVALALMLSPALPPERLAARSMAWHLANDPRAFTAETFRALRFETGVYGVEQLQTLASVRTSNPVVRTLAASALATRERYLWRDIATPKVDADALVFEVFPAGSAIDQELRTAIAAGMSTYVPPYSDREDDPETHASPRLDANGNILVRSADCTAKSPCPALFVDLDSDRRPEVVVFYSGTPHAFRQQGPHWTPLAMTLADTSPCNRCSEAKLLAALRSGKFQTLDPVWKELEVGGRRWVVVTEH